MDILGPNYEQVELYREGRFDHKLKDHHCLQPTKYYVAARRRALSCVRIQQDEEIFYLPTYREMMICDLVENITKVTKILPWVITLRNSEDLPYSQADLDASKDIQLSVTVLRGGMRNGLSPTLPFDPPSNQPTQQEDEEEEEQEEPEEEIQEVVWRDQGEGADMPVRAPSSSRSRSPATSMRQRRASPHSDGWWSSVTPHHQDPPSAQDPSIEVLVTEGELTVGYIWANPKAKVGEVLQDFADKMMIEPLIDITPCSAITWDMVARLSLEGKALTPRFPFKDLRTSGGNYTRSLALFLC